MLRPSPGREIGLVSLIFSRVFAGSEVSIYTNTTVWDNTYYMAILNRISAGQ
jgi:hypothetical protein